ncbi:hypothetical protein [Sphingobacterium kyonggiense]
MKNQFVPYELAVKLKELGFRDNCMMYYHNGNLVNYFNLSTTIAPLWQQAFDWFREKYGLICEPKKYIDWYFNIEKIIEGKAETDLVENTLTFPIYESARLACLEKLIELTK